MCCEGVQEAPPRIPQGNGGAVSTPTVSVFYLLIRTLCTFWISPSNQAYLYKNETKHSQRKTLDSGSLLFTLTVVLEIL